MPKMTLRKRKLHTLSSELPGAAYSRCCLTQYSAHLIPATARAATHLDTSPAHPTPKEALAGTPTAQNIVLSRGGEENKNVFK